MPDWKKIVREKLSPLPLENRRQEEIIEELAQQLESAYEDARASGASQPEALRRSLAQIRDWETLRREICRAVEGDDLPVLLEGGVMSRRWIPTWIALGLSLVLFVLPAFRHAVSAAAAGWGVTQWGFSDAALERLAREGAAQHDAHTLAFVALHDLDLERAGRLAEQAVALDSRLAWVYSRFVTVSPRGHDAAPWIARLKAADPENAFPALLEAGGVAETRMLREQSGGVLDARLRHELAKDDAWRQAMERAFAAPRYDRL